MLTLQFTDFIALAGVAGLAPAHHDPQGQRVLDNAFCVWHTWFEVQAGVVTFPVETGLLARAISVGGTIGFGNIRLGDWE